MTAPTNIRVVHSDGSSTPFEVEHVGREPRVVEPGEIVIVDVYEATSVLAWREGDRVAFDWPEDNTGACAIRTRRLGER